MTATSPFHLDGGEPFAYRDGVLHVGGLPVDQLAGAAGTPLYLYDLDAVAAAYRRLEGAFRPGQVLYSVKANSNLALLRRLAALRAGFDVVSGGELLRVLRAGARPGRVVFAGVGKTGAELRLAARCGVVVHVESTDELAALQVAAAEVGARARFGLRVNPDVEAGLHPYLRTGHDETKFGLPARTAVELFRRVAADVEPVQGEPGLPAGPQHVDRDPGAGGQLGRVGELGADVDVDPDRDQVGEVPGGDPPEELDRGAGRQPELGLVVAGSKVGVGAGLHVGVDPQAEAGPAADRGRRRL